MYANCTDRRGRASIVGAGLLAIASLCGSPLAATAQHAHRVPTLTMAVAPGAHPHAPAASMRGAAPPNDLCTGANIVAVPAGGTVTVTGDNTGSTDTEDFGNPNCWEAFSIDTCSTVTVSYCGTNPVFGIGGAMDGIYPLQDCTYNRVK